MKRSLFLLIYNICWHVVFAIKSDDIPISSKDFTQEFRSRYDQGRYKLFHRDIIQPNVNSDYQDKIRHFYNVTSHVPNSRLIKKSNITYAKHRRKESSEQERQLINSPVDDVVDNVGKAYGDPDNYQSIGDGVYLLNNAPSDNTQINLNKASVKDNLPAAEKTLNTLIGNLEAADNEVLNETPTITAGKSYNLDDENDGNDVSDDNVNSKNKISSKDNELNIPSDNSPNAIEGIIPKELEFIKRIESKIKNEDKEANENIKSEEDTMTKSYEKARENSKQHLENVAKEVENSDKDILKGNSLPFDTTDDYDIESLKEGTNNFKKDITTKYVRTKKRRRRKKVRRKIKTKENHNFQPEIIVGGSRSSRLPKKKVHSLNFKNTSGNLEDEKEPSEGDTGFFIADENELADLNKNSEKFVANTVNASVIRIIEPHDKTKKHRKKINSKNNNVLKNETKKFKSLDKQDQGLYIALNKSLDSKYKHKGGGNSNWRPNNHGNINISHKKGVTQIDLYLLNNRKVRRKRRNKLVRKANTPKVGSLNSIVEENPNFDDVEDVSVNEVANNQAKQMFGDNAQSGIFSNKGALDSLQNSHIEGNENKHDEVNIQDAINSEELKYAMKESDLKGLNQIQNELDFQDTKNAIDYFNQPDPSAAKSVSPHRISSNSIGDITDQIKEVETGFDNDVVDKSKSPEDEQQKVKIILHIPENMAASSHAKSKTKDLRDFENSNTLEMLGDQAKAYLNGDQMKDIFSNDKLGKLTKDLTKENSDDSENESTSEGNSSLDAKNITINKLDDETLEAARKIEEFIKQESKKKTDDSEEVADISKSGNESTDTNSDKPDSSQSMASRLGLPKKGDPELVEKEKSGTANPEKGKSDTDISTLQKVKENSNPTESKTETNASDSRKAIETTNPIEVTKDKNNTIKIVDSTKSKNNEKLTEFSSSDLLKAIDIVKQQQKQSRENITTTPNIAESSTKKINSTKDEDTTELRYADIAPVKAEPLANPHPTTPQPILEKFIKTIHDHALSKEPLKTTAEGVLPNFEDASIQGIIKAGGAMPLRINGGKVLGGSVRGGGIFGGVVSGGDVSGGEIHGGRMMGGTFKNGLLENGVVENGNIEGGKIRGGRITGGTIKSGIIDGGEVKGGTIEGGHLYNGTIEGGDFKGGEIYGGKLISGEMDGGVMKNGTINGGMMKGGLIESGELQGGIMLSGVLRGGIVKSGVIHGGVIDKGVIVQDAEIGPGVEIHEGVIKGGKITVNSISQSNSIPQVPGPQDASYLGSLIPEGTHTDENRSNIMYSIEVLPKPADSFKASVIKTAEKPIQEKKATFEISKKIEEKKLKDQKEFLLKSLKTMGGTINPVKKGKSPSSDKTVSKNAASSSKFPAPKLDNLAKLIHSAEKANPLSNIKYQILPNKLFQHGTLKAIQLLRQHHGNGNVKYIDNLLNMLETSAKKSEEQAAMQKHTTVKMFEDAQRKRNEEATLPEDPPIAHWAITDGTKNYVLGAPGAKLRMSGGITIRHGHAILDGVNGYFDGGDYQGECMSDPEVCSNGFTIQMSLKVYKNSVFNATRLFIFDTGATAFDSRGISIWVNEGRIGTQVSTREEVFCTRKILEPFIEKWVSLTLTWRKDKGLLLYINCELFDESLHHATSECDACTQTCHQTDRATRLMIGRPNKGPHFRVTHMAVGDILLHDRYSDKDDIKLICGSQDVRKKPSATYTQQQTQTSIENSQQRSVETTNSTTTQAASYTTQNTNPSSSVQSTQEIATFAQPLSSGQVLQDDNNTPTTNTANQVQEPAPANQVQAPASANQVQELAPANQVQEPAQANQVPPPTPANLAASSYTANQNQATSSPPEKATQIQAAPETYPPQSPAPAVQSSQNPNENQARSDETPTENPLPPAPAPPSPFVVHINTPQKDKYINTPADGDSPNLWPTPSSSKKRVERDKPSVKINTNVWPTPAFRRRTKEKVTATTTTPFYIDMNADRRSLFSTEKRSERGRQSVNGGYSEWTSWSPCSQNCGKGIQIAVRYCNNPLPKGSGRECTDLGAPRRFQECLLKECSGTVQEDTPTSTIHLDYGTKKSIVPAINNQASPMIIINGKQESLQDLATAFEQLKHR